MDATTRTILRSLHGEEARHVLERLLAAHPELAVDVGQLASGIVAGEETLIGWGPLEDHTHGLAESLAHTCRDLGLVVERDRTAAT